MKTSARIVSLTVGIVAAVVLSASAASAATPVTWDDPPVRSTLDNLILFGGGTIGLFAIVALFGLLTARTNYTPPTPGDAVEVAAGHSPAHH